MKSSSSFLTFVFAACFVFGLRAQSLEKVWEYWDFGIGVGLSNLQVVDVDGDGQREIVFGGGNYGNTAIYVHSYQGGGQYITKVVGFANTISDFALADTDGDGIQEIFAIDYVGVLHVLNAKTLEKIYSYNSQLTQAASIAVDDVNADGQLEVFIGGSTGGKVLGYIGGIAYEVNSLPVVDCVDIEIGDIDADGIKEIVFSANINESKIFSGTFPNFPLEWNNSTYLKNIALANVNADNRLDIVSISGNTLSAVDGISHAPIWTKTVSYEYAAGLHIVDVDNNGSLEILVGSDDANNKLSAYSAANGNFLWDLEAQGNVITNIASGDVDNDGELEIVWGTAGNIGKSVLNIIDANTKNLEYQNTDFFNLTYTDVYDFEGNGVPTIVLATRDYVADTPTPTLRFIRSSDHYIPTPTQVPSLSGFFDNLKTGITRQQGKKEMIWQDDKRFYVMDYDTKSVIFESPTFTWGFSVLALDDIDGDGIAELLMGSEVGRIYIFKFDGTTYTELTNFLATTSFSPIYSLYARNMDQDPALELVMALEGRVKVIDLTTQTIQWQSSNNQTGFYNSYVSDVNQDGSLEVVASNKFNSTVYLFDGETGSILGQKQLLLSNSSAMAGLATGEIDGEPGEEILATNGILLYVISSSSFEILTTVEIPDEVLNGIYVINPDGDAFPDLIVKGKRGIYQYEWTNLNAVKTAYQPQQNYWEVFPNPFLGFINIAPLTTTMSNATLKISLYDALGRQVKQQQFPDAQKKMQWNLPDIPNGTYFLLMEQGDVKRQLAVIVKKD